MWRLKFSTFADRADALLGRLPLLVEPRASAILLAPLRELRRSARLAGDHA